MNKKIEYRTSRVFDVLERLKTSSEETDKIIIPGFQRDYVWKKSQMARFLNSMIKQEPFGSIILWKPIKSYNNLKSNNHFLEIINKNSIDTSVFSYLVDGQQRLTSLSIFMFYSYCKDITESLKIKRKKTWDYPNNIYIEFEIDAVCNKILNTQFTEVRKSNKNAFYYEAWKMFNFNSRKCFQAIEEEIHEESIQNLIIDKCEKVANIFNNLQVSEVVLSNYSLNEMISIFKNINTQGVRLNVYEIINSIWTNINSDDKLYFDLKEDLQKSFFNTPMNAAIFNKWKLNKWDIKLIEIFIDYLYLLLDDNKLMISSDDKVNFNITNGSYNIYNQAKREFIKTMDRLTKYGFDCSSIPSKHVIIWNAYYDFKRRSETTIEKHNIILNYIKLSSLNSRYSSSSSQKLVKDLEFVENVLINENHNYNNFITEHNLFLYKNMTPEILKNIDFNETSMLCKYFKYLLCNQNTKVDGTKFKFVEIFDDMNGELTSYFKTVKKTIINAKLRGESSPQNLTALEKDQYLENRVNYLLDIFKNS